MDMNHVNECTSPPADAVSGVESMPSKKAKLMQSSEHRQVPNAEGSGGEPVIQHHNALKDGDANSSSKQMLFIELCAGSAVLSSVAKRRGFRVMPVGYKRNRRTPKCQIIQLDLSQKHAWDVLEYVIITCDIMCACGSTLWDM